MTRRVFMPCVALAAALPLLPHVERPATGEPYAALGRASDPESAATCGQCHTTIYEEWKTAKHAKAWDDPIYQESIKGKKRPRVCHSCHIPQEALKRLGRKPKTRKKLQHEGVNCIACHGSSGDIHGPFGAETDAHTSVKDPTFTPAGSVGLCSSCHGTKIGPVLPVARDYKRSDFFKKTKKGCIDCHMPEVERQLAVSIVSGKPVGEKRKGRKHSILGPNDPKFCARAFELKGSKDGAEVVLTIANKAGHRVPGLKLRTFPVQVVQLGPGGKELATNELVISHENGIKVLESREFRFKMAAGASEMRVVVHHHFQDERVATILTKTLKL